LKDAYAPLAGAVSIALLIIALGGGVVVLTAYMRLLKDRPVMADSIHIEPPDFSGLFTILVRDIGKERVASLMSHTPPSIRPQDNLMTAVNRIITLGVRRLLVVDGAGKVVGVIREQDLFFEIASILRRHRDA